MIFADPKINGDELISLLVMDFVMFVKAVFYYVVLKNDISLI